MKNFIAILSFLVLSLGIISPSYAISMETSKSNTTVNAVVSVSESKPEAKIKAKGGDSKIDKTVYIILSIIGLGWLAMGLNTDWQGSKWLICLLLTCLFVLPGIIYALVHMKDFY